MRNLKRALSLALSTVMLMGMMVVGSGAAGYTDVTSEHNQEAIEVMQAVGIMTGDDQGDFNPDQNVTRGEMAVIMSNLLDLGIANYVGAPIPFTDVPDWAHAYVAACYANGITGGTSDTTYGTDDPITAVQAGLMMLKALGYFQYQGDFDNNGGWILGTVSQAARIDLYDGIDAETEQPLTRNDIAQLALNTLEADMVEFTGDRGMDVTSSDGTTVNVGFVSRYDERTSTNDKYGKIDNETADPNVARYTMQLGEDLYNGDLAKQNTTDDFSRPATEWSFKNDSIGTYADTPDAVYTARVNADDIYSAVGKSTADDLLDGTYDLYSYVDNYGGKVALANVASYVDRNNTTKVNGSGNGMLTEVYVDHDDETVTIVSINTWVFQASADYSTTRESVNVVAAGDTQIVLTNSTLEQDDFDVEDVLADDYLLITATRESNGRYEVKSVTPAEVVTGVVDGYKVDDSVTIDGNEYKYSLNTTKSSDANATDDPVKSTQYTVGQQAAVVLDAYGHIIAVDEAVVANNYVYVSEFAQPDGLSSGKVQASAFFTDGTTETITVKELLGSSSKGDMVPSGNKTAKAGWYTYSANSSNEYSLYKVEDKYVPADGDWNLNGTFTFTDDSTDNDDVTYNDKVAFLAQSNGQIKHNTLKANNSTVVIVNNKEDDDVTAYVGVKNIPDIILRDGGEAKMTVVANASTNYAYYVYIETTGNVSISGSEDTALIYFVEYDGQHRGTDNEIYYTYTTLDGTAEASVEADALLNSINGNIYAAYYKTRTNSDGQLTDMTKLTGVDGRFFAGYDKSGKISYSDGALTIDGKGYTLADNYTITLVTVGEDLDSPADGKTASGLNKDKDAEYEVAIVTAQSLADTLEDCTGLVYDYQGKTTESNGTIIEELYVTVEEATVATGGGSGSGGSTTTTEDGLTIAEGVKNPLTTTADASSLTVEVNVRVGTGNNDIRSKAMAAVGNLGYTVKTMAANNSTITTSEDIVFNVTVKEWYTVTVDGVIVSFTEKAQGGDTTLPSYAPDKGYIVSFDGSSYAYQAKDTDIDTLNNGKFTAGKNVDIKTDYVGVTGAGVTGDKKYAKVGEDYTVPAKGSNNGTGMTYAIDGTTKYVAYAGTIPGSEITSGNNIALTVNYVKVTTVGFKDGLLNGYTLYNAAPNVPANASDNVTVEDKGTGAKVTIGDNVTYVAYGSSIGGTNYTADITIEAGYVEATGFNDNQVNSENISITWRVNGTVATVASMPVKVGETLNVTATLTCEFGGYTAANGNNVITAKIGGTADTGATFTVNAAASDQFNAANGVLTATTTTGVLTQGETIVITFSAKTVPSTGTLAYTITCD